MMAAFVTVLQFDGGEREGLMAEGRKGGGN